jgi:D-3-phosphoglycerate dehydrogenase / 2-oxoglutarate reductase
MSTGEMKFKVLHTDAAPGAPLEAERRELARAGAELISYHCHTEEDVIHAAPDADGLLVGSAPITRRVISALPRCQVIVRYGIGVDTIDVAAATEYGVIVANIPDFCLEEVANHAIMLLLACSKRLVRLDDAVRAGQWERRREILANTGRIAGQTLGLVAFGKIPRAIVPKARALQLRVLAYDPYVHDACMQAYGVTPARLDELLAQSDYVSVHTPLTLETRGMFDEHVFRQMKRSAFFINTSRGPVVNERALTRALQEGWIAGAGLDVFEQEPLVPESPLCSMPNVTLTPHSASYSEEAFAELRQRVGAEAARVLNGYEPTAWVNPEVKDRVTRAD